MSQEYGLRGSYGDCDSELLRRSMSVPKNGGECIYSILKEPGLRASGVVGAAVAIDQNIFVRLKSLGPSKEQANSDELLRVTIGRAPKCTDDTNPCKLVPSLRER